MNLGPGQILSHIKVWESGGFMWVGGVVLDMTEDEKSPRQKLNESTAEGCVCPHCGKDVQPSEIYVEIADSIGEIYHHPACADCGIYCDSWDNSHWYPEE